MDLKVDLVEVFDDDANERSLIAEEVSLAELGVLPPSNTGIRFRGRELYSVGMFIDYDQRRAQVLLRETPQEDVAAMRDPSVIRYR